MADVQSNIHVNIDTSGALASLKLLQRQISAFHTQMAKSGAAASAISANQAQNLMNSINATGQFHASMKTVSSSTESFTNALEKNKLTSREYFRYTGAATKTFGRLFKTEFDTINKVARERVKDIQTQYVKMGRGANGALQAIAVRPLTLDMKNLGTQTAMAAQRQQLLNQLLKQGSTNLLNFGKNTQWAGRQLMVGFTVPLMLLGSAAAKTFMQLEEQAIRFKRVYGEMFTTQEETDAMVKDIQLLAKEFTKYGVAVEKTMEMAADAAAMGKVGEELKAQVMEATRLAVLGGVEQEEALKTTISVTNAFGVAAEDLAGKIDFLNAVENQTVVSIEDLTIAIPKAGPVVRQLGGDVEDLAFFLTAMKEGGINASEGANALKSGLASLINPAEKSAKFLASLGININGIVEANAGDVKSTVVDFAAALDTLDPLNRARAIEQLFGKFQFSRLSTLFQNVTKQGTQASRVLELSKATTEELAILSERELARIEDSTTYRFKKTIEDLKVTLAPVGEQFLKALTPIVEFVGKVLEKFNGLGDGSKKFITMLTIALGAIGPVALMTFGLLANGVANIIKLFANMKIGFNRAGSSTQILGQQTSYLTKEQLEASAVAASLDQVHQKLRQTFTSETSAVNALALAYRNAIAAQVGFTGPIGKGRIPQSKKYSTGVTSIPGPKGAGDIVPIMASPGEAIIPAGPAQDPANKPFIAHMVAGKRLPGFKKGTTEIVKDNNVVNKTHVGGKSTPKDIQEVIRTNPYMSADQKAKLIAMEQIFKSQGLPAMTTTKHGLMFDFPEWMNMNMKSTTSGIPKQEFIDEWERRGPEKWKASGMNATQAAAMDRAFLESIKMSTRPYINDSIVDDIFRNRVPQLLGPDDKGLQKAQQLYATDYRFNMGKGLGSTPEESRRILQNAVDKGFIKEFSIKEGFATGEGRTDKIVTKSSTVTLNDGTVVNMNRLGTGTTPVISQKTSKGPVTAPELIQENMEKAQTQESRLKAIADDAAKTKTGQKKPTNFGRQISGTSGRSFAVREIGGLYEKPNGQKVFVKPMMSELDAIAEKKATDFARSVQGLDTPKQTISTMIDPTDPTGKRKIIVLESKFDPKYADSIPKNFTKDQYFRQLVSANLRGDKDLKRGNLGGNILTDVGTAGVFDKASGARTLAEKMPSLAAMAEENLKGVPGKQAKNSPNWFANATKDIALNMSPDDYDRAMKSEIQRQLAKAEPYVAKMPLTDPLRPQYVMMLERLREGLKVDWKTLHQKHSSILVKPDEVIEDENEKTKKIKSEPNNRKFKSTGGTKDTRIAPASIAPSVRQGPRGARLIGKSEAPMSSQDVKDRVNKEFSQSKAAASRTALYGSGPIDAEQKSLRRQLDKLKNNGQTLNTVASKVAVTQKVVTDNMTENVKKQGLAAKIQAKYSATKTARAEAKAAAKAAGAPKTGMGMGGAAMGVAGVAMVGSMIPGSVGEMFQKLMMPLMGLAMILPMLSSRMGALAVGVGAITAAYIYQRMQFDKAQDAAMRLTEAMGSGSESIRNLSKFANTVSAGETMDRKRKEAFSPFQIKTGKTTFGESFMAGEDGKAMAKNVGETIKSSGSKQVAQDQVFNQMATAVASGALSPAQARSIVGNLAQELGDYSFGISVNAKLIEFLGPNGENILKDPIGVRVKILQDTREKMNLSTGKAQEAGSFRGIRGAKDIGVSAGYTAAGAGIGAIAGGLAGGGLGGLIGSIVGPAGTVAGSIIGAKIGASLGTVVGGTAGNLFGRKDRNRRIGEASGASVAMQKMALEQQQEMMDSVELQYIKEMEIAKAKGDQNKIDELTTKYSEDRVRLLEENATLVGDIQKSFSESEGATRKALMTGVDKAITKRYKGTELEDVVPLATSGINDADIDEEIKYTLKMEMASGQIDPLQMIEIFDKFGKDATSMEAVATIITKFGGKFANEAMGVVAMFKDPKQSADFVARLSLQDPEMAAKDLQLFQKISQSGQVIDLDVALNYYNTDQDAREALKTDLAEIEALKGKVDLTIAATVLGKEEMDALRKNSDFFLGLDDFQQKVYMQNLRVMFGMEGDPAMQEQYKNWLAMDGNKGKTFDDFVNAKSTQIVDLVQSDSGAVVPGNTTGDKKGPDASPLDDLLKKLRDVRKNTIKVTKGFDASFKSLNKIFGGKKTIEVFSGIENDMRRLGAGEDLIELIAGMDPKEYEKQKNKLFKFDKVTGEIIKIKDGAKSIGDALQSIALGDFVSTQDKMVKNIGNQNTALARLKAAGVEGSVALDMVADSSTAAAIANSKLSDKQLKKVINAAKKAAKAQREMAAVEAIEGDIKDIKNRSDMYAKLTENIGKYSQAEIEAILNNPALIEGLLTGASNFAEGLKNELEKKKIELKIKTLTIEGMQDIFDTGVSNAMEAFDVQETQLRLDFNIKNKPLMDAIKKAEEQISLIQEKIRIEEIGLKEIEDQEEKVNEKYDERIEALEEVEKANASISQQQKGQLTLAEALTSGDIAAAARAAQEMRAQQAADAVTKQKEALEQSREYELSQLRSEDGRSRIQIETKIKELQDEIYEIEQKSLEPNKETLRLNELTLEKTIEGLDVLGRTREQWEQIKNAVDLARIASAEFIKSMQDAINIQQQLINAYAAQTVSTDPITPVDPATDPIVGATVEVEPDTEPKPKTEPKTEPKINPCGPGYFMNQEGKCIQIKAKDPDPKPYQGPCGPGYFMNQEGKCIQIKNPVLDAKDYNPNAFKNTKPKVVPTPTPKTSFKDDDKNGIPDYIQAPKVTQKPLFPTINKVVSGGAGGIMQFKAGGGMMKPLYRPMGGLIPYFLNGGFAKGTDTVPAMLTPGEFIMSKYAVDSYGLDNMKKINSGESIGGSVYNNTYTLTVNAKTNANPNEIAQAVMSTIKQVDDRRIRGVAISGRR